MTTLTEAPQTVSDQIAHSAVTPIEPTNRLNCRFCEFWTVKTWKDEDLREHSGWSILNDHVKEKHPKERSRIVRYIRQSE